MRKSIDNGVVRLPARRNAPLSIVRSDLRIICTPSVTFRRRVSDARMPDGSQPWDLESWDVVQEYSASRPLSVPANASKDYGYVDSTGAAHTVFRRVVRREGDV